MRSIMACDMGDYEEIFTDPEQVVEGSLFHSILTTIAEIRDNYSYWTDGRLSDELHYPKH